MKRFIIIFAAVLAFCGALNAQEKVDFNKEFEKYEFTTIKANPVTSVKNQYRSGTCWCFSGLGFVEAEVIRINGIKDPEDYPDFSEMFVVSKSYCDRADKYIRLNGNLTFAAGSECEDVLHVIKDYGIVPQSEMPGLCYGTDKPVHGELDAVTKSFVEQINKNPNRKLSTAWRKAFQGIVDAYLGECPETFTVDGKTYTPATYRDALKFNPDDYISLTSYSHHPFYSWFCVEIADNWRYDESYNVPIDELMEVIRGAIDKGYTVAWGADVSTEGFTRTGFALLPDVESKSAAGSDQEHWVGKAEEKIVALDTIVVEKAPTQESRQAEFDDRTMTDDHGMLIYGTARDQFGRNYFIVKNSWGITGKFDGIWYASENFVKAQTVNIMVAKSALPVSLKKRLGIK